MRLHFVSFLLLIIKYSVTNLSIPESIISWNRLIRYNSYSINLSFSSIKWKKKIYILQCACNERFHAIFMRLPASLNNFDWILLILRVTKQFCLEYVLCSIWNQSRRKCSNLTHFPATSLKIKKKNLTLNKFPILSRKTFFYIGINFFIL